MAHKGLLILLSLLKQYPKQVKVRVEFGLITNVPYWVHTAQMCPVNNRSRAIVVKLNLNSTIFVFVVQLVIIQMHNKAKQVEFVPKLLPCNRCTHKLTTVRGSDDSIVFVGVFFSLWPRQLMNRCTQLEKHFTRTCISTTSRSLLNFKVTGHFFVSRLKFTKLFSSNVGKIVVDNAVFRFSIARSVPETFAIKI